MKKVNVNVFDPHSIDLALKELNAMESRIKSGTENMAAYLADYCVCFIQTEAPGIDVRAERTGDSSWRIIASGDLAIALEFGEGVTAEVQMEPTVSGRYVKGPKKIHGLDQLNRFKSGGYLPGSGSHLPPQITEEDDEDSYDVMEDHLLMVMYNAAMATRSEARRAAERFFELK